MRHSILLLAFLIHNLTISQSLDVDLFASNLNRPVNIKHAGDDRLFVAEQDGFIKIISTNGVVQSTPFLNITSSVESGGNEEGLLGLAFHPNFASNGHFFVNYTRDVTGTSDNETVISRFTRSSTNPNLADPNSELVILTYTQPFSNHNGGELQFGPDGYLYISSGDGGSGGDPLNNSQNLGNLLGKLLRIDVNNATANNPYDIPADNPFINDSEANDEIWAYGLRNPWKFSFDRANGDIWIGDVGQNQIEEINRATLSEAGLNYGWRCYEGNSEFGGNASECSGEDNLKFPVAQYVHNAVGGCSITGGYMYRGTEHPGLNGLYFFSDFCNQDLGYLRFENGNWTMTIEPFSLGSIVAFGEDLNGELYFSTLGGTIYKIKDNNTLGANDNDLRSISIYPNPSERFVNIDFSKYNTSVPIALYIYDMQGKIVKTINRNTQIVQKIDVNDIAKGIYLLKIKAPNTKQITKRIVLN
ncbi:PQQ-dependent sugar dehydrogenase [uncultured Winogradskyella sp.]|uniref:PQQ-dependent sugar dehydrogenase n=1 Tax=uncultured Winogradskyella sp. TaxID=395353 RepID=UPI00260306C1|nr:PQQ-dependent sugar dehydrogenase [uncultured Winogradskyella sp.]